MSFEDIKAHKEQFLKQYDLLAEYEEYERNNSWDELMCIGEEYEEKVNSGEYLNIIQEHIAKIATFANVHSYRYRLKKTDSLLKKIIVKCAKKGITINRENYLSEITDLLGIRILYIFKEDCFSVHEQIMKNFGNRTSESVSIKLRDGDSEEFYKKIIEQTKPKIEKDSIYRSIHYTIYSNPQNTADAKIEIQTRTIFEEGWSEINHKLVYKNIADKDDVLKRASDVLNSLVGDCDKVGTMMKVLYDKYISKLSDADETKSDVDESDIKAKTVSDVFEIFLNN